MQRSSTVIWKGTGKEGAGTITSQSNVLNKAHYAWNTRFKDEKGTNPEELLAAAHAACFAMQLSFLLSDRGFTPEIIETTSIVTINDGLITGSHLVVKARVPRISKQKFEDLVSDARKNCPVSKALRIDITMEAELTEKVTPNIFS